MKAGTTQLHEYIGGDREYRSHRALMGFTKKEMNFWNRFESINSLEEQPYVPT